MVTAEAAGRVKGLHANIGDGVRLHQLLVRLDTTKTGHSLSLIKAQRDRARAALDKAKRDLSRAERLAHKGVSSKSQLDSATSAVQLRTISISACRT